MEKNETIQAYADRVMGVVNKLKLYGDEDYTEPKIAMKIIMSLPQKYEMDILALESSGQDFDKLTLGELINSLSTSDMREKNRLKAETEGAMFAKVFEKGK
ncbi:hypothetical protein COLO4_34222 [Corchorus olitorius]|uniref:Uncharacterized protein n=1 Tax=Corchorus olitorius TaxID=93759 RepID=A0A1R3GMX0_9ROSI|nr:hypothetical protein COLO4_34222 [Corchorus olitorius]